MLVSKMYLLVCDATDCAETKQVKNQYEDGDGWFTLEYYIPVEVTEEEEEEGHSGRKFVQKHLCSTACVANMADELSVDINN